MKKQDWRPPTAEDADEDGCVDAFENGSWRLHDIKNDFWPKRWRPRKPVKQERRELWQVWHDGVFFAEFTSQADAELCVEKHPDSDNCEITHLREVLPTDPDPDAVRERINQAVRILNQLKWRLDWPSNAHLYQQVIDLLSGGQDE